MRILILLIVSAACLTACSSETKETTPEVKKAFGGSAPPADYMKNVPSTPKGGPPPGSK